MATFFAMSSMPAAATTPTILAPVGPSDNDCASLWDVVTLGPTSAWAVGGDGCGTPNQEIQHWDGTKAVRYPAATIDTGGYDTLDGVSAAGPQDVWAVGDGGTDSSGFYSLVGHWDGMRWANVPPPSYSAKVLLADVTTPAHGDVWFAGSEGAGTALLVHRRAGKYTFLRFHSTERVHFNTIWSAGSHDIWAGGDNYLIHGDGQHWKRFRLPIDMDIRRLEGSSTSNVWAVGSTSAGGKVIHYNGKSWSIVPLPKSQNWIQLTGLAVGGPSDAWLAGYEQSSGAPLAHWNGRAWQTVAVYGTTSTCSTYVNGVALTKTQVLAVGGVNCPQVTGPMWWVGPRS